MKPKSTGLTYSVLVFGAWAMVLCSSLSAEAQPAPPPPALPLTPMPVPPMPVQIAPPTANLLLLQVPPTIAATVKSGPIVGFADIHAHQFSYLGFGQQHRVHGRAFGPIEQALPNDIPFHGAHLTQGMLDLLTHILGPMYGKQGIGHHAGGWPDFNGWPRWDSVTHQTMYEDWLYRAHQNGLQLMVTHAVNNEWMCATLNALQSQQDFVRYLGAIAATAFANNSTLLSNDLKTKMYAASEAARGTKDPGCRDMNTVDAQIQEAKEMEAYISNPATRRPGGPPLGWYRIVYTPQEARRAIAEGKLAVVLGIEVDNLFDCDKNTAFCTPEYIKAKVGEYYDARTKGIRHVFPIHFYDNTFGGSANSQMLISKRWDNRPSKRECLSEGYQYDDHRCNVVGLTVPGKILIGEMMKRGMIIDIDHMSALAKDQALAIAESIDYPLVSGHSGFVDISFDDKANEDNLTARHVERLRKLGGMVAVIPHQGDGSEIRTYRERDGRWGRAVIEHTCGNSSETVAQAYLYAIDRMKGGPVGFGSDLNGLAGVPGPRFGLEGCTGSKGYNLQQAAFGVLLTKNPRLNYPFRITSPGMKIENVAMSAMGTKPRTFDFNVEGLAHVGMLPDMIADWQAMGMTPQELAPLFNSAEGYIRMWEKAESRKAAAAQSREIAALAGQQDSPSTHGATAVFVWSAHDYGSFRTTDGDTIIYEIRREAVDPGSVQFVLALDPAITWEKWLNVPDGEARSTSWDIKVHDTGQAARGYINLHAHQTQNGQQLTFRKKKGAFQGFEMREVLKLGNLQGLGPGSLVTFTWVKD